MIPYGYHSISDEDIDAVVDVLRDRHLTQGDIVPQFESAISSYCGTQYALAVSSGTAALHLACLAIGLGPGDILWTTPNTFVATANCARYCGADVDFVDIDPNTYNLSVEALADKLEQAARDNRLPKVIVPVHFAGHPCDMREIDRVAKQYGVYVIEDACHALGARYEDQPVGNGRYADITVFSFHPVKMITTGEGGMLLTNNKQLYDSVKMLRSHGITKKSTAGWYYEQNTLGFNYRLTDMQAALGLSQLTRLDKAVEKRAEIAQVYHECLGDLPLELPKQLRGYRSAWHLYVIQITEEAAVSRSELYRMMHDAGIGVSVHYIPVHIQPYYRRLGFDYGQFPVAEAYYEHCLTLPLYPALSDAQQDMVISTLTGFLE